MRGDDRRDAGGADPLRDGVAGRHAAQRQHGACRIACSVDRDVDRAPLAALVASRAQRPFRIDGRFSRSGCRSGAPIGPEAMYTVKSRYFLVSGSRASGRHRGAGTRADRSRRQRVAARRLANDRVTATPRHPSHLVHLRRCFVCFSPPRPTADRADSWVRYARGRPPGGAVGATCRRRWPADAAVEVVLAAGQVASGGARPAADAAQSAAPGRAIRAGGPDGDCGRGGRDRRGATSVGKGVDRRDCIRALIRAIAAHSRRVVAHDPESALAPHADGWTWCASAGGRRLRAPRRRQRLRGRRGHDGELPAELRAALAQARRAGIAPAVVHAALPAHAARLAQWSQAAGVPFVAAPAWRWERATPRHSLRRPISWTAIRLRGRWRAVRGPCAWFRPALLLGALALGDSCRRDCSCNGHGSISSIGDCRVRWSRRRRQPDCRAQRRRWRRGSDRTPERGVAPRAREERPPMRCRCSRARRRRLRSFRAER